MHEKMSLEKVSAWFSYNIYNTWNHARLLFKANAEDLARKYLTQLPKRIRLFIAGGEGYGDQVAAVNIIRQLVYLGYRGKTDIVGSSQHRSFGQALPKLAEVLSVDYFDQEVYVSSIAFLKGIVLHLIPLETYIEKRSQFKKVELSIFVGKDHIVRGSFPHYWQTFVSNFAQSDSIVQFDPFSYHANIGFRYQQNNGSKFSDVASKYFPYRFPVNISNQVIRHELRYLKKHATKKLDVIQRLLQEKNAKNILTFPIYGMRDNIRPNKEVTIVKFIAAALEAQKSNSKPLVVVLLNNFKKNSWHKIQKLILDSNYTSPYKPIFINAESNNAIFANVSSNATIILNLGSLPIGIFNKILLESDLLPVIEGVNARNLQNNAGRYSLMCQRSILTIPGEYMELPTDLFAATNRVCADSSEKLVINYADNKVLAQVMQKYSNATKPQTSLPDRVSFGLSNLKPRSTLSPKVRPSYLTTTGKSFLYGVADGVAQFGLTRGLSFGLRTARSVSNVLRFFLMYWLEGGNWISFIFFVALMYGKELLAMCGSRNSKLQNFPIFGLMFLSMSLITFAQDGLEGMLAFAGMLVLSAITEYMGCSLTQSGLEKLSPKLKTM